MSETPRHPAFIVDVIKAIHAGAPLTDEERKFVIEVLVLTVNGKDPCRYAGTEKQRGGQEEDHFLLRRHYAFLRRERGGVRGGSDDDIRTVAKAWGLSFRRVKNLIGGWDDVETLRYVETKASDLPMLESAARSYRFIHQK